MQADLRRRRTPGSSEGRSSTDFDLGDGRQLAELGEHPAALLPAAVHEHQGDVVGRGRGVAQQAVDRLLGQVLEIADHDAPDAGEERRRRQLAERGQRELGGRGLRQLRLGVVAAHGRATTRDGALAEELLLAGHERDPAENVCGIESGLPWCGQPATAHPRARASESRPRRGVQLAVATTTARSPSRSVRTDRRRRRLRAAPARTAAGWP